MGFGGRMMSTITRRSIISPWLMLPPSFKGRDMLFNFYSLAEDKIVTLNKRGVGGVGTAAEELPDNDAKFVGSSHGWLALLNNRNNNLFLSNPLSGRHIKLPPLDTLPYPEFNLRLPHGRGSVSKLILSCSPDEPDCRAMMSFGPGDRLAFCCLPNNNNNNNWTPIGDLFFNQYDEEDVSLKDDEMLSFMYGRAYEDFVYCRGRGVFSCTTQLEFDLTRHQFSPRSPSELEDWDLTNPRSPMLRLCHWMEMLRFMFEGEVCPPWLELLKPPPSTQQIPYLVFSEQHDQLFIVTRFVCNNNNNNNNNNSKTVGFCVVRVSHDEKGLVNGLRLVDMEDERRGGVLDGLAMFIGMNHSFAVSAAEVPNLKPNSIYFTDAVGAQGGGGDIGVFDYENKCLLPTRDYLPPVSEDVQRRIAPTSLWFTPNPPPC